MDTKIYTYTYAELDAAVCIWEWFLESPNSRRDAWTNSADWEGYANARHKLIGFCKVCEQAWLLAYKNGEGYDGSFDWEFIPAFMTQCVEWTPAPKLKSSIYIKTWAVGLRDGE